MQRTVLIVEDQEETSAMLQTALEHAGYGTACANSIKTGKAFLKDHKPALILLDLKLTDGDGLELCALVRASEELKNTPIIAVTGQTALGDKKRGFAAGIDQYLSKPIEPEELLLWVNALLRRVEMHTKAGGRFSEAGLEILPEAHLIRFAGSPVSNLTRREFDLLKALALAAPKVFSRREILEKIWKTEAVENLVDTHIFNLRRKLNPELAARIVSVSGKGFRYLAPEQPPPAP